MTVSAAKLEANRRNAAKSTGPRTERGKQVSSLNAVTHGLRAETLVLGDEDPQALEARRAAWRGCLLPADEVELRLVDDAVVHTWMQDRARRAQAARAHANLAQFGVAQAVIDEKEVEELGQRLYQDRLGPLTFYPTGSKFAKVFEKRTVTTSYAGDDKTDPDRPSALVLRLQATLKGCEWMLGEWAELKAILDRRQKWLPCDKLKAVRLLGKQPLDAIDDRDVAMVFLATSVLAGSSQWFWEISTELSEPDLGHFRNNAATRKLKSLKPRNSASAREALLSIIERATERLTLKAEIHRERARLMAALAPDLMAFDESQVGERLRRYELASGRGLSRSLEEIRKHRRSALSVVSGPLSVVSGEAEASTAPSALNERTDHGENAPNEATDRWENVPNEPTDAIENVTNEPTDRWENVPNEPTDAIENVTNEPTGKQRREQDGRHADAANEPSIDPLPGIQRNLEGVEKIIEPVATEEPLEVDEDAIKRIRRRREEYVRQLNEQAQREAAEAMAARRARRREQRAKNHKPGERPKRRLAHRLGGQ